MERKNHFHMILEYEAELSTTGRVICAALNQTRGSEEALHIL